MTKAPVKVSAAIEFIAAMLVDSIQMVDEVKDEQSFKAYVRKTAKRYPKGRYIKTADISTKKI